MIETTKVPHRTEIPVENTWDLSTIFADDQAWEQAFARVESLLPKITALDGKISEGPSTLLQVLNLRDEINRQRDQLDVYAVQRRDSDSTDSAAQALVERLGSLTARVSAVQSFIKPQILALPEETLKDWQQKEPGLQIYAHALEEFTRQRAHVRTAEVENILAQFSDITRAPGDIFSILTNADLTFPTIEDERGQQVTLSHARYGRFMESKERRVRQDNFKGYYSAYQGIRNTLGTTLAAAVRTHVIDARMHNYDSALEAALKPNDIPLVVYHNLLNTIDANLDRLHRYMALRKRIMGLDELHPYDLYAPLVPEVEVAMAYAEGGKTVRAAFAPLGSRYVSVVNDALTRRWIDVYENVGKRSGAYSNGSYGTAPFILLNYQDRLNDVFTLAHELGHSLHSYFTWNTQPYVYGTYTIFLAEVASTLNENLLTDYLLKTRSDPALRKHLLVQQLEDIRTTIFRQTMFATFELDIHQRVEAGEALTTESLSKSYYELVKRFHGPDVVVDDEIRLEWARIPHFYYNFYVFQYATGLSAALALSEQIISEGQPAVDRYLRFLSSGSSRSSIDLLRDAGVDMTTPAPIQAAMDTFDHLLDELEALSQD